MVRGYSIGEVLRVQNGTLAAGPSSATVLAGVFNSVLCADCRDATFGRSNIDRGR